MLLQVSKIHSFCDWVVFHCTYIHHIFIHSSDDGCLVCFHILPVSHTATVNIAVHVCFWISGYKITQDCDCRVVRYHCTFNSQNSIMGALVQVNYFYNLYFNLHTLNLYFSVQSLSPIQLFGTPWIVVVPASLSISLLKLMSIESMMPSNHLILCLLSSCLQSFPVSGSFPMNESVLRIRWPKYWSFSFSPSSE